MYAEGLYRVEFTSQALGVTSNKGTPQFVLKFCVLARISEGGLHAVEQYERAYFRPLTEKTIPYFMEDLDSLAVPQLSSFKQLDPSHANAVLILGEGEMYCKYEDDQNGKPRERWGVPRKAGGFEVPPLPANQAQALDNMFGAALRKRTAPAKPAAPTANAAGITDDDVSF